MNSINDIQIRINELGKIIDAPRNLLNISNKPIGDGTPHVEVSNDKYFYIISERGKEYLRKETSDFNDLMYYIFRDLTRSMGFSYELDNRVSNKDCRRIAFNYQIELLAKIDILWAEKEQEKMKVILKNNPYVDNC